MDGLLRRRGARSQRLLRIDGEPVLVGMVQPARDRVVFAARGPSEAAAHGGDRADALRHRRRRRPARRSTTASATTR